MIKIPLEITQLMSLIAACGTMILLTWKVITKINDYRIKRAPIRSKKKRDHLVAEFAKIAKELGKDFNADDFKGDK